MLPIFILSMQSAEQSYYAVDLLKQHKSKILFYYEIPFQTFLTWMPGVQSFLHVGSPTYSETKQSIHDTWQEKSSIHVMSTLWKALKFSKQYELLLCLQMRKCVQINSSITVSCPQSECISLTRTLVSQFYLWLWVIKYIFSLTIIYTTQYLPWCETKSTEDVTLPTCNGPWAIIEVPETSNHNYFKGRNFSGW